MKHKGRQYRSGDIGAFVNIRLDLLSNYSNSSTGVTSLADAGLTDETLNDIINFKYAYARGLLGANNLSVTWMFNISASFVNGNQTIWFTTGGGYGVTLTKAVGSSYWIVKMNQATATEE